MGGRGLGQPAAGREGIIGTSTGFGEGEGTASCMEGIKVAHEPPSPHAGTLSD